MDWYYAEGNRQIGPITESEFKNLAKQGNIKENTLVWHSGLDGWKPYQELADLPSPAANHTTSSTEGAPCGYCHQVFPKEEMVTFQNNWICSTCKPVVFQKFKEGQRISDQMRYGGFWIRFGAKILDTIILYFVNTLIILIPTIILQALEEQSVILQIMLSLVGVVVQVAYMTFFVGKFGATPGKMVCRLKVIRSDGSPVTYRRAFGRVFAEWISSMILCIGYMMAGWDDEKRTLHDRICDTRVIYA